MVDVQVQLSLLISHADFQRIKSIVVQKLDAVQNMWLTKLKSFSHLVDVFKKVDLVVKSWLSGLIVKIKVAVSLPISYASRCSLPCRD